MQPELPSVAVIIPAYNAESFLERAVCSVYATGYPNVEVVIVDDGSTDGTRRLAAELARRHPGSCRVLRHPGNARLGVSASRNLGIRQSASEWVCFLDADDAYLTNRFRFLQCPIDSVGNEDHRSSPNVAAVYGLSVVCRDGDGESDERWGSNNGSLFGIRESLASEELLGELLGGRTWAVSAITIRRNELMSVGLFPEKFAIAEDCHLWVRLVAQKLVVAGPLDEPCSVYYRHASNTFELSLKNRIHYIDAMLDALNVLKRSKSRVVPMAELRQHVHGYARRVLAAARVEERRSVARRILSIAAAHGAWRLLLDAALVRAVAASLLRMRMSRAPR